ncbi:MAG: hypothetical protein NTY12_03350 [Candidatus Falkowbacteria bacterium]|nr:hypothetical protein [Candidatus Falkowbacteria bacterium]
MTYKSFIIIFVLIFSLGVFKFSFAQTLDTQANGTQATAQDTAAKDQTVNKDSPGSPSGNNQVVSRDAIGLRLVPNPEHLAPIEWYYKNIKVKGSPQSLLVDGYEAVRDGRTVYVSASKTVTVNRCSDNPSIICQNNTQCTSGSIEDTSLPKHFMATAWAAGQCVTSTIPELYTNIYVISYNQSPETSTTDIFGQLLQYWKFNIDVKNCSRTVTQTCVENVDCPKAENGPEVCGSTGYCNKTIESTCVIDSDCPQGEYCNSKKSTIIRDTKRLADLVNVKAKLESYNKIINRYPRLDTGTYLTNRTISTWPSWAATFSSTIGSAIPNDPVNKLGQCKLDSGDNARFDVTSCWDENAKEFSGTADPLTLPANSRAYYYQYKPVDNSYKFCAIFESGYVHGKAPLTPVCQTGRSCNVSCANKHCGDNGCGGSCGSCANGQICQNFQCRADGTIQN